MLRNKYSKFGVLLLTTLCSLNLCACSGTTKATSQSNDTNDALVVATNATFSPYEYVEGGGFKGIDIEFSVRLANKLGKSLDIKDVEFDEIVQGVQTGLYDVGISGITKTSKRSEDVNFSKPYVKEVLSVVVKNDSLIKSVNDIGAETRIGVKQGSTGDVYATDDYGKEAVSVFKDNTDAIQNLLDGTVDCLIMDKAPAEAFEKDNSIIKVLNDNYIEESYVVCVSKDNEELLGEINKAIDDLSKDGSLDAIIEKYIPSKGRL